MIYLCYCAMIVLPIWQDSPLSGPLGSYGYSIVPVLSLAALIPFAIACLRRKPSFKDTFAQSWTVLLAYLVLVNIIANVLWLSFGGAYELRGEDIVAKSLKGIVTAASIATYLLVVTFMTRQFDEERVLRPFAISFAILTVVAIVEYAQLPNALPFAHYAGVFPYDRPRFLTIEASWTTLLIITYGGLTIHYFTRIRRSYIALTATVASLAFMVLTTTSKSLLLMVAGAVLVSLALMCRKDIRWVLVVVAIVFAAAFNPIIFDRVQELFVADIENYTSTATRAITNIASFVYSLIFPFGAGNALYLHFYPEMLQRMSEIFSGLGIQFNLAEVNDYITASDDFGMSAKSAILQYGMYWGIVGTIFLIRAIYLSSKACWNDPRVSIALKSTAILTFVSVFAFMTFDSQYEFFALMVVLDYYAIPHVARSNVAKEAIEDGK